MRRSGIYFALLGLWLVSAGAAVFAQAMQRPDAGTLQEPQRQILLLPQPGAPQVSLPEAKPAVLDQHLVRMTPTAFRFEGNTVFSSTVLSNLVADRLRQPTDLAGLAATAALISSHYRAQGYLLTEAYLPEQAFSAEGGTVTIAVIEARIGKVLVQVGSEQGSASYIRRVATVNLPPGELITEYLLEKPVLLLRDLAGIDASATVEPGAQLGQADVVVTVHSRGRQAEGSVVADNFGAAAAGARHVSGKLALGNFLGRGDVFSAQAQLGDASRNGFYRLGYALPIAADGTQLAFSAAHTDYALGRQFAALGATGKADVRGASLTRPLIRSRDNNLYGLVGLEHKTFVDLIANPSNESERRIVSTRWGLLGNFVDEAAGMGGSSAYALTVTLGRARLDAASLAFDQGFGGLQTAESFRKFNLEFQRAQFFGNASSVHLIVQAQWASKNLASAEKMALGGPAGVRGYPVGEGIGDAGALFNLEYRYQLPAPVAVAGEQVSLAAFYDYGTVRFNQKPSWPGPNRLALGSVGIGLLAGRANNFLITTYLAWRTTSALPTTGDPDRAPRAWVSAQKWF